MTKFNYYRRALKRLLDRWVMRLWQKIHPCRINWIEYDHDWKYFDDSFSHEFGTEICGHWECLNCGETDENREPPPVDYELFDYETW